MAQSMKDLKKWLNQRIAQLVIERAEWEAAWRDISEQLIPYRVRWEPSEINRGRKKDNVILNNAPVLALNTQSAGLMAGVTSPARRWWGMSTVNPETKKNKAVKVYLDQVRDIIDAALHSSTWYSDLADSVYPAIGSIGTAALFLEEKPGGGLLFTPIPTGEYYLGADENGKIDTCFRKKGFTTSQLVSKFGVENVSREAAMAYRNGEFSTVHVVNHGIYPNEVFEEGRIGPEGKRWSSAWWEDRDDSGDGILALSGYEEFPVLAPRWRRVAGDVYGRGPGWDVRGDCRVLQHREKRKMEMVDKIVKPPMKAAGKVKRATLLPGDVTHMPAGSDSVFEPAMTIQPQAMAEVQGDIVTVKSRIDQGMHVHIWQAIINDARAQRPTATEVEAIREEAMLMLGPLLENMDGELLGPAIERTYAIMLRNDLLPPPPPDLEGQELEVKFISIVHQVQQATGLHGLRTVIGEVTNLSGAAPEAMDKLDVDNAIDEFAKITGVRSDVIRSDQEVEAIRAERAKAEQMQREGEAALAATQGAKNLGQADVGNLQEIASAITPVAAAQGGALGDVLQ